VAVVVVALILLPQEQVVKVAVAQVILFKPTLELLEQPTQVVAQVVNTRVQFEVVVQVL
jgi:hypothetical protein